MIKSFLMGAAETLPAINGSIVALVLGIYQKRIEQINIVVNSTKYLVTTVSKGKSPIFREVVKDWDLKFIFSASIGLFTGLLLLTFVVMGIFENTPHYALSFVFGLVLAVIPVPVYMIGKRYLYYLITVISGIFAFLLLGINSVEITDPSAVYLAISGFLALSGMIVPGLSGSFILLVLGVYYPVISSMKDILTLQPSIEQLIEVSAFSIGAIGGLVVASRVIKHLLEDRTILFMAVILGLILGSLKEVFPFVTNISNDGLELETVPVSTFEPSELVLMTILLVVPALVLGISNVRKLRSGDLEL